jgi:ectoine hydroxylase-related dioxygenase (phytanoyl-CoA dioxygenase family)
VLLTALSPLAALREVGCVVLPGAVPMDVLDGAEAVLDDRERQWEEQLRGLPGGRSWISEADAVTFTPHVAWTSRAVRRMLRSEAIATLLRHVIGSEVRLAFDQAVYKKPGCERVLPWHQDDGYNPKAPSEYVSLWVPLTDSTIMNGTIRVQPGRHLLGLLPHWRDADGHLVCEDGTAGGLPIELRRGDVLAISSLLPYASGPNMTSSVRKAYVAICVPDGTTLLDGTPCDRVPKQPLLLAGRP